MVGSLRSGTTYLGHADGDPSTHSILCELVHGQHAESGDAEEYKHRPDRHLVACSKHVGCWRLTGAAAATVIGQNGRQMPVGILAPADIGRRPPARCASFPWSVRLQGLPIARMQARIARRSGGNSTSMNRVSAEACVAHYGLVVPPGRPRPQIFRISRRFPRLGQVPPLTWLHSIGTTCKCT